jgi:hypothetical protein
MHLSEDGAFHQVMTPGFGVMKLYKVPGYGPHLGANEGWIARAGEDKFAHTFGGRSWDVCDVNTVCSKPTLLMNLDLEDPRVTLPKIGALRSLPLCSHINCDAWTTKQTYQINPFQRTITLVTESASPEPLDEQDLFPNPLPEKRIRLDKMNLEDYPVNEEMYWQACDRFLGSRSFIRVLGPPLWLQWVEEEICECGLPMEYVCSIGHEDYDHPSGIIPNRPFFIGEAALYFFVCPSCLKVVVTSQSS